MSQTAPYRVRPAGPFDAAGIAQTYVRSWRQSYRGIIADRVLDGMDERRIALGWRQTLTSPKPGQHTLVAGRAGSPGSVVGFLSCGPAEQAADGLAEIFTLYLLRQQQGLGLGRRLVAAAAESLLADGQARAIVWVLFDNPARGFYEALGGQLGRQRTYQMGSAKLPAVSYQWPDLYRLEERAAGLSAIALGSALPPLLDAAGGG
ncbi:MAG: GNAT family N-acetyltransferase [Alphaproteobacteria bacterium]|nr:GNAT family N-acetyltransferase [Alphaproteobacteria bacterium]